MTDFCNDYLDLGEEASYWCNLPKGEHEDHEERGEHEEWRGARRSGRTAQWRVTWRWVGQ